MLIRSQVNATLMLWKRGDNVFSQLPIELIPVIKRLVTPDKDFLDALHNAAFAELKTLKTKLDAAKAKPDKTDLMRLLLQAGDVVTPGGKLIGDVTLLDCALGAGDIEMAEMIKPYFDEFAGGKREFERQRERYRSCIEAMATQQHDYDITWLVNIIKKSSLKDVAAERATGDKYDLTYQSPLRDAMNKFRDDMLDPKRRIIKKPRMHCNYKNFDHVDDVLEKEWDHLMEHVPGQDEYEKHRLIACQIYGLMELLDLPAYERCVFAQDDSTAAFAGRPIKRSFDYKSRSDFGKTFPAFSKDLVHTHSGAGFDFWISIFGLPAVCNATGGWLRRGVFKTCVKQKQQRARTFMQQQPDRHPADDKRPGCVIL